MLPSRMQRASGPLARTLAKDLGFFCRSAADRIPARTYPEKVRQFGWSQSCRRPGCRPVRFRRSPVKKARKTALSSTYLWQRPSHKHLFTLRNRLSTAHLAALTGCSAACEFAGLGVTSRNAVRTGGVFLNGGIGGGRRTSGHCSLRQCAARSWLHVRARTVIRLSPTRSDLRRRHRIDVPCLPMDPAPVDQAHTTVESQTQKRCPSRERADQQARLSESSNPNPAKSP